MISTETFQNKSKLITRRMFILSTVKLVVFVSIISRLFYLQISENLKLRRRKSSGNSRLSQHGNFFGQKTFKARAA